MSPLHLPKDSISRIKALSLKIIFTGLVGDVHKAFQICKYLHPPTCRTSGPPLRFNYETLELLASQQPIIFYITDKKLWCNLTNFSNCFYFLRVGLLCYLVNLAWHLKKIFLQFKPFLKSFHKNFNLNLKLFKRFLIWQNISCLLHNVDECGPIELTSERVQSDCTFWMQSS